jgi:hypothetical protein
LTVAIRCIVDEYLQIFAAPHLLLPSLILFLTSKCPKVGIPVCLYDSDPTEPDPLYLRVGLCFQCQRNLNEQRRAEKKRPGVHSRKLEEDCDYGLADNPNPLYPVKRHKDGKRHLDQSAYAASHEAIIEGMRPWSEGYGFREMGPNLVRWTQEVGQDVVRLVQSASPGYPLPPPPLHHTGATNSTGAVESAMEDPSSTTEASQHHHPYVYSNTVATTSHNGTHAPKSHGDGGVEANPEAINLLYSKVFQTLHKSLFLLSQWKLSWDAVHSIDPTANDSTTGNNLAADSSALLLHDAVASAAAVAAMTGTAPGSSGPPLPPHHHSPSMPPSNSAATTTPTTTTTSVMANDWPDTLASLLLAADQSNDHYTATSASSETHHDNDRVVDWQFQHTARHDREDDDGGDGSDDVGTFDDV